MVLKILITWIALGALAVLFMYCCSRVSNGPRGDLGDDDFAADSPEPMNTPGSAEPGASRLRGRAVFSEPATERYPRLQERTVGR